MISSSQCLFHLVLVATLTSGTSPKVIFIRSAVPFPSFVPIPVGLLFVSAALVTRLPFQCSVFLSFVVPATATMICYYLSCSCYSFACRCRFSPSCSHFSSDPLLASETCVCCSPRLLAKDQLKHLLATYKPAVAGSLLCFCRYPLLRHVAPKASYRDWDRTISNAKGS